MLYLYTQAHLAHTDLMRWVADLDKRRRGERGMSESVQTALLVVLGITVVGLLAVAITTFIQNKAAIIAGS
jgi:hypothetical protein